MQPGSSSVFSIPRPPPLPSPPLLEHLLLESPLPLAILLVIIAFIAARIVRRRPAAPRSAWAAVALLFALGPGIYLLATLVVTDREHMRAAVSQLVRAVARADSADMDRLLAPDCSLFSRFGFPGYQGGSRGMDKDMILTQVPATVRANPIVEQEVVECQPHARGPGLGTTQLLVRVVVAYESAGYKLPVLSWWRVDWRRDSDGRWRAISIEALTDPAGQFR